MSTAVLVQPAHVAARYLRALGRQPLYVVMQLVQPLIWLLLFGQLFKSVVQLHGFGASSYITYLAPGVLVMSALLSNGWSGTMFIVDMERGVLDRMLATPARRTAFLVGQLAYWAVITVIQSVILLGVAYLAGARFPAGLSSLGTLIAAAVLLGLAMAGLSNTLALRLRQQDTVIAVNVMLTLPLCFLSSTFMPPAFMPGWIQTVARYNPVNWAVEVGRQTLNTSLDWAFVAPRLGLLVALAVLLGWATLRSFRAYLRAA